MIFFKQWLSFSEKNGMIDASRSTGLLRVTPAEDGQSESHHTDKNRRSPVFSLCMNRRPSRTSFFVCQNMYQGNMAAAPG